MDEHLRQVVRGCERGDVEVVEHKNRDRWSEQGVVLMVGASRKVASVHLFRQPLHLPTGADKYHCLSDAECPV